MLDHTIRTFLHKTLIARMTTIGPDGYPHTVPVWFMLDGDDVVIISARDTRKVKNIQANPKGSVAIGGDPAGSTGYLLQGDFVIEEDPDDAWVKKLTYHYEDTERAEQDIAAWADLDIILIRLKPKKVIKVA
jgi:PPOX class probable F420-dependent enzyme